jgi:hypothetical protein
MTDFVRTQINALFKEECPHVENTIWLIQHYEQYLLVDYYCHVGNAINICIAINNVSWTNFNKDNVIVESFTLYSSKQSIRNVLYTINEDCLSPTDFAAQRSENLIKINKDDTISFIPNSIQQQRNDSIKRELMEYLYHPKRIQQWIESGNEIEDYLQ